MPNELSEAVISAANKANQDLSNRPLGLRVLNDGGVGAAVLDAYERAETAGIDSLTGLPNEAMVSQELHAMLNRTSRCQTGERLLVVKMDIRYFKAFDDLLSWNEGNWCLRHLGKLLKGNGKPPRVRAMDLAGRLGGDDFVLAAEVPAGVEINKDFSLMRRLA